MASRHPSDELLMSYASGALEEAFALVVNCHLQFCERCTKRVREMEDLGAALLTAWTDTASPDEAGFRDRTMDRFAQAMGTVRPAESPRKADPGGEFIMPRPLALKSGWRRQTISWTPVAPGLATAKLAGGTGPAAATGLHFLKLDPGVVIPSEVHRGDYLILVLWGDYRTDDGLVRRGDLHEISAGTQHSLASGTAEGVTCIVATDASALAAQASAVS